MTDTASITGISSADPPGGSGGRAEPVTNDRFVVRSHITPCRSA